MKWMNIILASLLLVSGGCQITPHTIRSYEVARSTDSLAKLVQEGEYSWQREQAALALGKLKDPTTVDALIRCISKKDEQDYVKIACCSSLAMMPSPKSIEPGLAELEMKPANEEYRYRLVVMLSKFEDARIKPLFETLVNDTYLMTQLVVKHYLHLPLEN